MNDFIELVKEGFRLVGNIGKLALGSGKLALDQAKVAILVYFHGVKKWTLRFFAAALVPLIVILPCQVLPFHIPGLSSAYVIWLMLILIAELLLLSPLYLVLKQSKRLMPDFLASDLNDMVALIKSAIFNGLSIALFVAVFPRLNATGVGLITLVLVVSMLTMPACAVSSICKRILPYMQIGRFVFLACVLLLQVEFPNQMEHLGWAGHRKVGTLLDPVKQREITGEWKTLAWFSNNGDPLVWYSGSATNGYRLWNAPGSDPQSGMKLLPVADDKSRKHILFALSESERVRTVQIAAENAKRMREDQERVKTEAILANCRRYFVSGSAPVVKRQLDAIVMVAGSDSTVARQVEDFLVKSAEASGLLVRGNVLTKSFTDDGLLDALLSGHIDKTRDLALSDLSRTLWIGQLEQRMYVQKNHQNLTTCDGRLVLRAIDLTNGGEAGQLTIAAMGTAFSRESASALFLTKLQDQMQLVPKAFNKQGVE
jgi:hypothetical protein